MPNQNESIEHFAERLYDPVLDRQIDESLDLQRALTDPLPLAVAQAPPTSVDLSPHLHYIRCQDGAGCWGYSTLAAWDIMNELACPYTPNLSMRLWMMLHRRRELWEQQGGIYSPDGRFHSMSNPEYGFLQSFGCTTEGADRTLHRFPSEWPDGGWSREGINEASNYRLAAFPKPIDVTAEKFVAALSMNKPFRMKISGPRPDGTRWGHWIAVVGYDLTSQRFTYVNSGGDKWGNNGYGTYTFAEIDAGNRGATTFDGAEGFEIIPPRPVPAARISFTHSNRANVVLRLGVEGSPHPPREIWPQGWDDNSRNLSFTVRLPPEFVWPPTPRSRIYLELHDTGAYSTTGGTLTEFSIAFGGDVRDSADVPLQFAAGDHLVALAG